MTALQLHIDIAPGGINAIATTNEAVVENNDGTGQCQKNDEDIHGSSSYHYS